MSEEMRLVKLETHVLVTTRNGDIGIVPLCIHHSLNTISNEVSGLKPNDMPLVPMEIPSLTPMVLNLNGTNPACRTPSLTALESLRRKKIGIISRQHASAPKYTSSSCGNEVYQLGFSVCSERGSFDI